ncbi:MAG: tetratricopeptide repeat protein [Verrucomicrobia bacterium]|nr:tetratricopeptide repeat protein [Verrucomicrobiota bacterium]
MDRHPSSALVFISYSSANRPIAEAACESLEKTGIRCWIAPRNVDPGVPYAGQIIQGLRESKAVVLLFSDEANRSANVLREIEFATNQRLPVLSLRLDGTVMSDDLAYYLRVVQWHDVSGRNSDPERVADLSSQVSKLLATTSPGEENRLPAVAAAARFGDFEILGAPDGRPIELGRGGMGVTYRARQVSMGGREVALKVINPALMGDEGIRKRFLREAQIAGAVEHPNVALVYSRGQEGDSYFYAMQLVNGVDLERYVRTRGPLSVFQALTVTGQAAAALEAARTKGLIHRDIKPSNIMAVEDRRNRLRIKLIDFGLAKNVGDANAPQSIVSGEQFIGTFAYASPEQCRQEELDTRSDVYSLGITLWFLLTGKTPFHGSPAEVSGSHLFREPPFGDLPELPPPVIELLKSLLAKDPAERPQTPAELEDRVEELLRSLPADSSIQPSEIGSANTPVPASESDLGMQTLIGSPVLSSYLAPAAGQTREERFHLVAEQREGVSGRLFRAREDRSGTSREVGLKFLHPSIVSDAENRKLLSEQFERVRSLSIDHLVAHYSLELDTQPPFLVREWLNGFSLSALLRWRQSVPVQELITLLAPLPALLDQLSEHSLALIEVGLGKIFLAFPPEVPSETFAVLAKRPPDGLRQAQLKLNPLSLRGLVTRSGNSDSDPTMLSTSRLLALTQAKMGIRGKSSVQLLGQLIYELLSGRPYSVPDSSDYVPLTAISEFGNRLLRAALVAPVGAGGFSDCQSFWQALGTSTSASPKISPVTPLAAPVPPPRSVQPPARSISLPTPPPAQIYQTPGANTDVPTQFGTATYARGPGSEVIAASPQKKPSIWPIVWILGIAGIVGLGVLTILAFSIVRVMLAGRPSPASTVTPTPSVAIVQTTPWTSPATETPRQTAGQPAAGTNVANLFNQARGEADAEQNDKAVADYTEVIQLKPDYAEAYNGRGQAYFKLKQFDKAISDYGDAIRIKADFADAYSNRAFAYTRLGQYEKALADCNEAIRIKPDFAEAYKNRANPHNSLQQYEDAINDCNQAIRLKPDYAEAYANRATGYNGLKQYDKAIADCEEALRLKPGLFQAHVIRGTTYNFQGQFDKAVSDFTEAIRLQPDLADAYFFRGYSYINLKQYDACIADSTEAIRLNPSFANAYNNRAYAHYCLKQYAACLTDATEAIRLDPKLSLAYSNRGDAYVGLKQYKAGIEDFTEAIRLNPQLTNAYIDRGYTHLQLKEYDACIADCTEALRVNSNLPLAYNNRGYAHICLKQFDLGIADCTEAITLDPNLALAYLNRAFGYQQVGEIQKAKADRAKGEQLKGVNSGLDRPAGR